MSYTVRLLAAFIAILLVCLFPLQYVAEACSENIDCNIDEYTKRLSKDIQVKGYINKEMYENYINLLDSSGEQYDIDIEDIHPVAGEDITDAANDNFSNLATIDTATVKESKITSFSNTNVDVKTEGIKTMSLTKTLPLLSEASAEISSFALHTHTDACYAGHRHTASCAITPTIPIDYAATLASLGLTGGGFYPDTSITYAKGVNKVASVSTWFHSDDWGGDIDTYYLIVDGFQAASVTLRNSSQVRYYETNQIITFTQGYLKPNGTIGYSNFIIYSLITSGTYFLGSTYDIRANDYFIKNPMWPEARTAIQQINNWTTDSSLMMKSFTPFGYVMDALPADIAYGKSNTFASKNLYDSSYSCGQVQDETPICNQVVTSITATSPTQTIFKGGSIVSSAIATHLDTSTGTVSCTVSGLDVNTLGTQTATLTYSGLVGNAKTTGTRTCTVSVTVKSSKTLSSIGVSPGTQLINLNGTPSFTVTAYYSDGSNTVLANTAYTKSGLNVSIAGTQTVTFSYTEGGVTKTTTATVRVDTLTAISITPSEQTVTRYTPSTSLAFAVTAAYLYSGNKTITSGYVIRGYTPSTIGDQSVTISYTENGITKTTTFMVHVTVLHKTCPRCKNIYELNTDDSDPGCPFCRGIIIGITVSTDNVEVTQGEILPISVTAKYNDGSESIVTGWTSNYDSSKTGLQVVTIMYREFASIITVWVNEAMIICPVCGNSYPVSEGKCPVCATTVVSIRVVPQSVTVCQYENVDIEVEATYADGTKGYVTDWSIDRTTAVKGTYLVTVTYNNITASFTLIVISATAITCPICGTVYDPVDNPRGCPICSTSITQIEAYLTSESTLVQYGSTPGVAVVLIFRDTHREIATDGYTIEDYDANKMGLQTITILYDGFSTTLAIEVVNTLNSVTCPKGHVYYLNDDGSDPGCPYCSMVESSGAVLYFDITYVTEIVDTVYSEGRYYFEAGNYITVSTVKRDKSVLTNIQNKFLRTAMLGRRKKFIYGGEVL